MKPNSIADKPLERLLKMKLGKWVNCEAQSKGGRKGPARDGNGKGVE
jgi:hypothetical protein